MQEDHELIEQGDRAENEWIMDAVTHQPIGRQAAIKGKDGIFYWDLSAKPPPFTKKKPVGLVQGTAKAEGDLPRRRDHAAGDFARKVAIAKEEFKVRRNSARNSAQFFGAIRRNSLTGHTLPP